MWWIKNGKSPDVYTGLRLASAFGVSIKSLFSENDVEDERLNHELIYLLKKLNRDQLRDVKKHLEKYNKQK